MDNTSERRRFILGSGALLGTAAMSPLLAVGSEPAADHWDVETDLLCVGSGAASLTAAAVACQRGVAVTVIEKLAVPGGTTRKSGGVAWIPNNPYLDGHDPRDSCLRYLARYAHPERYEATSPTLGLDESAYQLLAAFYDNGSRMVDLLQQQGIMQFRQFRMRHVNELPPDYADHLEENEAPYGRSLEPVETRQGLSGGTALMTHLLNYLESRHVTPRLDCAARELIMERGRVIGLVAHSAGKDIRIKANQGVVFGTGGFALNQDLVATHQPLLYGTCAMPGSNGDFVRISAMAGARMGSLHTGWRTQVLLEEALQNPAVGLGTFVLPGDSMLMVNKYGKRVVNEKRNYNDRTRVHFVYDPVRVEYPNQLLFMLFDNRSLDAFGGSFPIPVDPAASSYLIQGESIRQLVQNIQGRLQSIASKTGGLRLADDFLEQLQATITRYNGYAIKGQDAEFDRGYHAYDRAWHEFFSPRREGTSQPVNEMPNITMHPMAPAGPYYAYVVAPGVLDTSGGPIINQNSQVLGASGDPIPGLYGAGNCIASPTGTAYYGAGGTIGPAMTFGYIAAMHATSHSTSS